MCGLAAARPWYPGARRNWRWTLRTGSAAPTNGGLPSRVDSTQRQRQVVAAAAGALARLADQHLAGLARGQGVHDGAHLLGVK
jgi:hypothetical protein